MRKILFFLFFIINNLFSICSINTWSGDECLSFPATGSAPVMTYFDNDPNNMGLSIYDGVGFQSCSVGLYPHNKVYNYFSNDCSYVEASTIHNQAVVDGAYDFDQNSLVYDENGYFGFSYIFDNPFLAGSSELYNSLIDSTKASYFNSDGSLNNSVLISPDGTSTTTYSDGSGVIVNPDGTTYTISSTDSTSSLSYDNPCDCGEKDEIGCISDCQPTPCYSGLTLSTDGYCRYLEDCNSRLLACQSQCSLIDIGTFNCVQNSDGSITSECICGLPPLICPDGQHEEYGVCVDDPIICDEGYHVEDGVCVPDTITCPDGQHEEYGVCVDNLAPPLNCSTGFHEYLGVCVPDAVESPDNSDTCCCPAGTYKKGSFCYSGNLMVSACKDSQCLMNDYVSTSSGQIPSNFNDASLQGAIDKVGSDITGSLTDLQTDLSGIGIEVSAISDLLSSEAGVIDTTGVDDGSGEFSTISTGLEDYISSIGSFQVVDDSACGDVEPVSFVMFGSTYYLLNQDILNQLPLDLIRTMVILGAVIGAVLIVFTTI